MTLQERMVRYRAIHRLSQKELAEKCGLSLQTINSIENGLQNPSRVTAAKIALVVDVNMDVEEEERHVED